MWVYDSDGVCRSVFLGFDTTEQFADSLIIIGTDIDRYAIMFQHGITRLAEFNKYELAEKYKAFLIELSREVLPG